jgi:signal transduction histidine kinase
MEQSTQLKKASGHELSAQNGQYEDHWKRFSMMVAHDLKEPLLNVASCAKMLAEDESLEVEERKQMLRGLHSSADRLRILVNELFEFARLGGGHRMEWVDLTVLTSEIKSDLRCLLRRTGAHLSIGEMPRIKAARVGMRVILGNLIENAIKYGQADRPVKVTLNAERTASGWLFSVGDNGMGIASEHRSSLFDPFRRLTLQGEGAGLGLSHVMRVVEEHNGWIDVESEVGVGSTFRVFIPDERGIAG